jgi:hypothetical protein
MNRVVIVMVGILALGASLAAKGPMATASSGAAFELRGAMLTPGEGVPAWPLMAGDLIKAGSAPVTLTFADGSRVMLEPKSVAQMRLQGQTPVFDLEGGGAQFSLISISAVKLTALGRSVTPTDLTGRFSLDQGPTGQGTTTPSVTSSGLSNGAMNGLAIGGVVAAGVLSVSVYESGSGNVSSVSPIK